MRTILCFGDSNTWGHIPGEREARYPFNVRWPGALQRLLGSDFHVVEAGLNGRTTNIEDPAWPGRNGRCHLPMLIEAHSPIDLLVIMLGTNDIKAAFNVPVSSIAQGMAELVMLARNSESRVRDILLVSPPHIVETDLYDTVMAYAGSLDKSKELAAPYARCAQELNCRFVDAASWVTSSIVDGIHLDEAAHLEMGAKMSEMIGTIKAEWSK